MKKILVIMALAIFVSTLLMGGAFADNCKSKDMNNAMMCKDNMTCSKSAMMLMMNMTMLWEEHVMYTRNYIISALADLPDADMVAKRLLMNQEDIGNAVKPYYGTEAGNKLTSLLKDHIMVAAEVVKAAKTGNADKVAVASKKWIANADELAIFLSGANPNWSKKELTDMLHKHLQLTTDEVVSRINKDWAGDIKAYDAGNMHMMMFAKYLTMGIMKQFPDKFKK